MNAETGSPNHWPYPGARWWRFDFHTHTPASTDTRGWQQAIGTDQELNPETWLRKYMEAEIDCVAVTDHNSGGWIDRLKAAYSQMQQAANSSSTPTGFRELHLFPGVEISVQGGFHLLALFDTSATSQTISDLLARVDYDGTRGDSDGVTRKGAAEVVEAVLAARGIPIPAHADAGKGLLATISPEDSKLKIDTTTVKQVLAVPGLLAMEWCNPALPLPAALQNAGLKLTKVIGSDCHSFWGSAVPGSRFTWVKMAEPSLEGLRLALLDGQGVSIRRSDDNVGFDPFKQPEHFIESIVISNAKSMGLGTNPAQLKFNPYFNALIGGRGTGKSTVIHALRLACRRERELVGESEAVQTFNRFNKVANTGQSEGGLRTETQITVQFHRDGILYRLIWRQDGTGHVLEEWDVSTQSFRQADSQSISAQRFPLRLFSQGQIAALAGDSQAALLKVIDDAAGTATHQLAFEDAQHSFKAIRAQLRELKAKLQARDGLNIKLQDVQRQLTRFEVTEHATILKNYQHAMRQSRELDRQFAATADLATSLQEHAQKILVEDFPDGLFDTTANTSVIQIGQKLQTALMNARTLLEQVAGTMGESSALAKNELEQTSWFKQRNIASAAYAKLKSELALQGIKEPEIYGRLIQEKHQIEYQIRQLDALQTQYDALLAQEQSLLASAWEIRRKISACRKDFLDNTLIQNPHVQIKVGAYMGPWPISLASNDEQEPTWADNCRTLTIAQREEEIKKARHGWITSILGDKGAESFKNHAAKIETHTAKPGTGVGIQRITVNADAYDYLDFMIPEDLLDIRYSRKGDGADFTPIGQASAGQRACAMLAFLLSHGNEPLVLDQPEDDLDNHLIYDLVVQQIRSNKQRRQLIIVTHNPNIVVNGDAELIHILDFNHQCFVKQSGSLQDQAMRTEVCQVMEGGKEAFERRYQRLGREV